VPPRSKTLSTRKQTGNRCCLPPLHPLSVGKKQNGLSNNFLKFSRRLPMKSPSMASVKRVRRRMGAASNGGRRINGSFPPFQFPSPPCKIICPEISVSRKGGDGDSRGTPPRPDDSFRNPGKSFADIVNRHDRRTFCTDSVQRHGHGKSGRHEGMAARRRQTNILSSRKRRGAMVGVARPPAQTRVAGNPDPRTAARIHARPGGKVFIRLNCFFPRPLRG